MQIKKKFLEKFNKFFIKKYSYGLFPTVKYQKIKKLINSLKVYDLGYPLIRVGPKGDGGYLVPDLLKNIKVCFSPGVGQIHGFEMDLLKRGIKVYMADNTVEKPNLPYKNFEFIKKNIGSYDDTTIMTLDTFVEHSIEKENFLLQMDIEGDEYTALSALSEKNLKKFKIMVIEFHNFEQILTKVGYKIIESVLIKILKYFDITHIHPNNCCGSIKIDNIILPSTLEITFLSKELTLCKNKIDQLPHQLDCPNVVLNDEIILDKSWYV
jgi:hypothetical protein